jgi:agmatine deiminase
LNRNRNPRLSRAQIERHLKGYLGVTCIVWLGSGVFNDETDGHVDNLACFVRPGEVCLTWCDDPRDPQHAISQDALARLMAARDARDRRLQVHKLPAPGPLYMSAREAAGIQRKRGSHARVAGSRLAGSYVNFYLANGALVMPLLDPHTDRAAARQLKRLFPDRKVVGVQAREILLGGGNIHCITQQVPRGAGATAGKFATP